MKTYKFITENTYDNRPKPYLAIGANRIETLNDSDTYTNYGQQVSAYDAGDNIELKSENAIEMANKIALELDLEKEFNVGSFISAFEDGSELYDEIKYSLTEDEDYVLYCSTLDGFNFWNGHNWQTVSVSCEFGEPSHELIDDEELEEELNNTIKESEFVKEGFGRKIYETDKYWIVDNYCEGHFEAYQIYNKEEFELEEI